LLGINSINDKGSFPTQICSQTGNGIPVKSKYFKMDDVLIPCVYCIDTCPILPDTYQESIRRLNFIFLKTIIRYFSDTFGIRAIGGGKTDMCGLLDLSIIFGIYVID
jgi:hypothetical protein